MIAAIDTIHKEAREFIDQSHGQFIDGAWVNEGHADLLPIIDPATEARIGSLKEASTDQVRAAVEAARRAFRKGSPWRTCGAQERERLIHALAQAVRSDASVMADLISADMGAPRIAARLFEVESAVQTLEYFAGFPTKISGRTLEVGPVIGDGEYFGYTTEEPVGVVVAIVPWNAPLMIAAWKLAPALAAGCTVVMKPSEEASLAVLRLADLVRQVGFPKGVFNVVIGRGDGVGNALIENPHVDKFAFTGSTEVGKLLFGKAADRMVRLSLELGGKSPVLVLEDADIDAAVPNVAMGGFANSGQLCVAGSRVLVHRSIADQFTEKLLAFVQSLTVGPGLQEGTQIGPVASETQYRRVLAYIERGRQEGGKILTVEAKKPERGYFISPTVIADLPSSSRLLKEEIFGPVMTLESFDDPDAIIDRTNESPYGLSAIVWGSSHAKIQRIVRDLRVGTVFVNSPPFPPAGVPTGGFRQSGVGRDLGHKGLEGFLETKSVIARVN